MKAKEIFARLYESYLDTRELNRHQRRRIPLPFPKFVVFYNGEQELPEVFEMRLSDSFDRKDEDPAVECVAKVININYGHNKELMDSCRRLHDYSYFVATVRRNMRKGYGKKEALVRAVDECIEKGILKDVLVKHRAEVEDMFLTTFNKKMYEEALQMDARAEGLKEGRECEARDNARNLFANGVPYDVVRASIKILTDEELQKIYKEVQKR